MRESADWMLLVGTAKDCVGSPVCYLLLMDCEGLFQADSVEKEAEIWYVGRADRRFDHYES